jgi:hypothetical protein
MTDRVFFMFIWDLLWFHPRHCKKAAIPLAEPLARQSGSPRPLQSRWRAANPAVRGSARSGGIDQDDVSTLFSSKEGDDARTGRRQEKPHPVG